MALNSPMDARCSDMHCFCVPTQASKPSTMSTKYFVVQLHKLSIRCRVASKRQLDISYLEKTFDRTSILQRVLFLRLAEPRIAGWEARSLPVGSAVPEKIFLSKTQTMVAVVVQWSSTPLMMKRLQAKKKGQENWTTSFAAKGNAGAISSQSA